ncbi:hypothetical protein OAS95_02185 [Pelagibacteraceae bacterium]|nr:hypothetical protein [Pelagibacteraceae bacterium]
MSNITDLNGLVTLQKEYLKVLENKPNDPELTTKVAQLQTELESAYASLETSNISSSNVLTHQEEVADIVDTEKDRLLIKKQYIDNALVGKERAIELNDSYQKKQAEYNKIKFAWVIALAISVILVISKKTFVFLPSFIFDLFTILVLLGASIYTISILVEVSRREKINFNKLDLPDPAARTEAELQAAAKAASKEEGGDLLGGMNLYGCVGSYCCSPGTKWDNDITKCVHDAEYDPNKIQDEATAETFNTMINTQHINKRRININNVKENCANEYDNYSKV